MELPSKFQINDEVTFRPMYKHQQMMGIADEELEGKVVAIRFTEAKVFYDVYSPYWGNIFEGIDSIKVYAPTLLGINLEEPIAENK